MRHNVIKRIWGGEGKALMPKTKVDIKKRTLDLSNSGGEDILLSLVVTEALEDGVDDGLDELGLLALLRLLLEADPRVEDRLDLGGEGDLLALDKRLGLELCGLLLAM